MWGKTVRGMEVCEIPVRLPMDDAVMQTVECMWVDIWCMLDFLGFPKELQLPGTGLLCKTSHDSVQINVTTERTNNIIKLWQRHVSKL